MTELVMRGGHHGAFCTFLAEVSHKHNIKMPAKLARTYRSQNLSQEKMLQLMLNQELYSAAIRVSASAEMSDVLSADVHEEGTLCNANLFPETRICIVYLTQICVYKYTFALCVSHLFLLKKVTFPL